MMIKELTDDNYRLRLLCTPYAGHEHILKVGKRIRCGWDGEKSCALCRANHRMTKFFVTYALDRRDDICYPFRFGTECFMQISDYARDVDYGDPTQYDLQFNKTNDNKYQVTVRAFRPLNQHELDVQRTLDKNLLLSVVLPISPREQCVQRLSSKGML